MLYIYIDINMSIFYNHSTTSENILGMAMDGPAFVFQTLKRSLLLHQARNGHRAFVSPRCKSTRAQPRLNLRLKLVIMFWDESQPMILFVLPSGYD